MTERAKRCEECRFFVGDDEPDPIGTFYCDRRLIPAQPFYACAKGHRPRYYKAVKYPGRPWDDVPAGCRRRCSDFAPREGEEG